jgi:site-specific recombinase XerD
MRTHSPENERIKRAYFTYLKEARRLSEPSIDAVAAALSRFEQYTRYRDFKSFHQQQAIAFKRRLAEQISARTGEQLSKRTVFGALNGLRTFFQWLAGQPGYRSRLTYADADYFSLSEKETRIATAHTERPVPTLEQIHQVLQSMPADTDVELRNRALVAFTLLTGARDGAIASMNLKHVDVVEGKVMQDAREVHTKFSKSFTTTFFPVGDEVREMVVDWVSYLTREKFYGPTDPLFPATKVIVGEGHYFRADGLTRLHWSNATPIRAVFKEAFERAGLPYANPHSFRKTLAQLGERLCRTPEEFKAWSQNLGHEQVLTTFSSYGTITGRRQAELIRGLSRRSENPPNVNHIDEAISLLEQARHRSL